MDERTKNNTVRRTGCTKNADARGLQETDGQNNAGHQDRMMDEDVDHLPDRVHTSHFTLHT